LSERGPNDPVAAADPRAAAPTEPQPARNRRLRALAIALSAPSIFYGVLGVGSTFIVWSLIQFDPLRPDFYLGVFAAAGPAAFLIRLHGLRRHWRVPSQNLALVLNVACIVCALLIAILRSHTLRNPFLAAVLVLLTLGPALNTAVLLTDPDAAD
jgi:hypothetical protein